MNDKEKLRYKQLSKSSRNEKVEKEEILSLNLTFAVCRIREA